jgi:hypothetical protein
MLRLLLAGVLPGGLMLHFAMFILVRSNVAAMACLFFRVRSLIPSRTGGAPGRGVL